MWSYDLIVTHEKFEVKFLRQVETIENLTMPISSPTLRS